MAEHSIAIGRLEGSLVGRKDCFLPEELGFGKIVPALQLVVLLLEKTVERLALLVRQMAHKLFDHFVPQKVLEQSALLVLQKVLVFCCHNLSFTKNLRPSSSPLFVAIV